MQCWNTFISRRFTKLFRTCDDIIVECFLKSSGILVWRYDGSFSLQYSLAIGLDGFREVEDSEGIDKTDGQCVVLVVYADQSGIVHDTVSWALALMFSICACSDYTHLFCCKNSVSAAMASRRILKQHASVQVYQILSKLSLLLVVCTDQQPRLKILDPICIPQCLAFALGTSHAGRDAFQIEFGGNLLVKEEVL